MTITVRTVAMRAGVPPITASRVVQGNGRLPPAPRRAVGRGHLLQRERQGFLFVLSDRGVGGVGCGGGRGESGGGARRLVEHLVSLGHRRIAMIAETLAVSTSRDRRRGYEEALAAAGIAHD